MDVEQIHEEIAQEGTLVRVEIRPEMAVSIVLVEGGHEKRLFVDSAWGFIQFGQDEETLNTVSFFGKYRSLTTLSDSCQDLHYTFAFGHHIGLGVRVNGEPLPSEQIRWLTFFANTDFGTILVSFCPFIAEDAQPLIMEFSAKKRWRQKAQHLAVAWLHAIWGMQR